MACLGSMEEWRDVKGYEGLYQVSNEGRVKSLERVIIRNDGVTQTIKEKMLKLTIDKDGYLIANISVNGITYKKRVHRLVAQAFIPNPANLPIINHKDECKTNNFVENLEWCTCKYNLNYGTNPARISERVRNNKYLSKEIAQMTLDNNIIRIFPSIHEVERELGLFHTNVSSCALGKQKTCGGFRWQYTKDFNIGEQKTVSQ